MIISDLSKEEYSERELKEANQSFHLFILICIAIICVVIGKLPLYVHMGILENIGISLSGGILFDLSISSYFYHKKKYIKNIPVGINFR